jgi:hypothetical protein
VSVGIILEIHFKQKENRKTDKVKLTPRSHSWWNRAGTWTPAVCSLLWCITPYLTSSKWIYLMYICLFLLPNSIPNPNLSLRGHLWAAWLNTRSSGFHKSQKLNLAIATLQKTSWRTMTFMFEHVWLTFNFLFHCRWFTQEKITSAIQATHSWDVSISWF